MKWGALAAVAGAALIVFSQPALGALLLVVGFGLIAFESMRRAQQGRPDAIEDEVSPTDRHLLAPIRKQLARLEEIVEAHADNAGVKVIGGEALEEGRAIYRQCVVLAVERAKARKYKAQLDAVRRDKAAAEQKLAASASQDEKELYEASVASYAEQERLLAEREERFQAIDAQLAQAEAALKLIVAQLSTMAQRGYAPESADDALRDSLSRLQALGQSLGETGEFLENIKT